VPGRIPDWKLSNELEEYSSKKGERMSLILLVSILFLEGLCVAGVDRTTDYRIERIVIDPGHGGWDSGAVGPEGVREKAVTLSVALKLAKLLDQESSARVYLTRQDDFYVPLRERTLIANRHRADLFLSLHCNSVDNRSSHGTEVYFCSENASDRMAELVAERENAVAREEETEIAMGNFVDVEDILFRLERKLYWKESEKISKQVIERMIPVLGTANRGVKSANFSVLRTAKMPSILVEIAFLSNHSEEQQLNSDTFQKRTAEAIFRALKPMTKSK